MSWVTKMIRTPRARASLTIFSMASTEAGSRLAVGSSRNRTSGSVASARAKASRCASPPDSSRAGWLALWRKAHVIQQPVPPARVLAARFQHEVDVGRDRPAQ
jgi:hypothetical protein